jgi:hypothetical protein
VALGGKGGNGVYLGFGGWANGGGIYDGAGTAETVTITNSSLSNNQAQSGPGGTGSTLNTFPPNTSALGAGAYLTGGTVVLSNDLVEGNEAIGGSGNSVDFGDGLTGNALGGGLWLSGTVTLSGDTVSSNLAQCGSSYGGGEAAGGGVYVASGTVPFCTDTAQSNTATTSPYPGPLSVVAGGGIDIASGATVYVDSFTVNNTINNRLDNIEGSYVLQNC